MTLNEEQTTPEVSQESTSQVEEQETTVTEDQTQDTQSDEDASDAQTEVTQTDEGKPEGEGQQQHEEENKPTRAEKRLQQLLSKKKEPQENPFTKLLNSMPEPEPDENGYFTVDQVKQLVASETARAIELNQEVAAYRENTEEFVSDIEDVGEQILKDFKDNPELAGEINSLLTQQIMAANIRTDQRGNQILVPVQKASQLYTQIKKALNLTEKQGTEKVTAALVKQASEGAITPGNAGKNGEESLSSLKKQLWNNPGKVRQTLEKRLSRTND